MKVINTWLEAVDYRSSRRSFTSEIISKDKIAKLDELIYKINTESGLNIQLIEEGADSFGGFKATYGMLKGVNTFVALVGNKNIEGYKREIGYFGEAIVLEATMLGLSTCWVGGTYSKEDVKKVINLESGDELIAVLVIGHANEKKDIKEKLIKKMSSNNKDISYYIENDEIDNLPNWVIEGLKAVSKAPSALNKKPVRFKFYDDKIKAYTFKDNKSFEEIDLGIAMLHFEIGSNGQGFERSWHYENGENIFY